MRALACAILRACGVKPERNLYAAQSQARIEIRPKQPRVRGNRVSKSQLSHSNRYHIGIVDDHGERIVQVTDLCERLGVDALIRLHLPEYTSFQALQRKYIHFNLETTLNQVGKHYAILPIIRSGYRTNDETEILPVVDPRRHRVGKCDRVIQRVPIDQVSSEFFEHSLPSIQTAKQLATALIERYAPLFPQLTQDELLLRGCAVTRILLE